MFDIFFIYKYLNMENYTIKVIRNLEKVHITQIKTSN